MHKLVTELMDTTTDLLLSLLRLSVSLMLSVVISLGIGILAARSRTAERVIVPFLDVLQSIPILGFFPVVVYFLISLVPGLGAELAAIFLIMTSQMWNITFGVYEAVKTLPRDLLEVTDMLKLGLKYKIAKLYYPAALPKIASNLFPSWANGFFFLTASEIISLGGANYRLRGIGSRIMELIDGGDYVGLLLALVMLMTATALITELFFRPLLIWSEKYRFEVIAKPPAEGAVWIERVRLHRLKKIKEKLPLRIRLLRLSVRSTRFKGKLREIRLPKSLIPLMKGVLMSMVTLLLALSIMNNEDLKAALYLIIQPNFLNTALLSLTYSTVRVLLTVMLTLCWTIPLVIYIYHRPRLERLTLLLFQTLASIPAPLLYPVIANGFKGGLIELGVILMLMIGSQWYLFYNIYDGLKRFPNYLEEVLSLYNIKGLMRLRLALIPSIMPSLFTGLITFVGGCWNALVVAEKLRPGLEVEKGIGKLLVDYAHYGDLAGLYATLIIMTGFIVGLNKGLWSTLRDYVVKKFSYEV